MKNKSYSTLLTLFFVSCGLFKSAEDYFDEAEKMRSNGNPLEAICLLYTSDAADE